MNKKFIILQNLIAGEPSMPSVNVNAFTLNLGGETSGIVDIDQSSLTIDHSADAWFDLCGRRLSSKPTVRGIYIHKGKKVYIR